MKMLPVFFVLLLFVGCSPQKSLASRLRGADRVVVTNTYDALSITVTGANVGKIVQAIASAKKESSPIKAAVGYNLEFYKGAQHLGTVITAYGVFAIDQNPYLDTTDTVKALYERFREEHSPKLSP